MSILIMGSEGSMGKRYQAILNYLGKNWIGQDFVENPLVEEHLENGVISGFIIATPTECHADHIRLLLKYGKPILCEKPITKSIQELKELFDEIRDANVPFHMMYQYKNLIPKSRTGKSFYDYFRHGNDGLIWDCLQIIGLSKEEPQLREDSPIWKCRINGHSLNLRFMDEAYITSVLDWIQGPSSQDLSEILVAHEKTWELNQCQQK